MPGEQVVLLPQLPKDLLKYSLIPLPNFFLCSHELLGYRGTLYVSIISSQNDERGEFACYCVASLKSLLISGAQILSSSKKSNSPKRNDFLRPFWISPKNRKSLQNGANPSATMTASRLLLDKTSCLHISWNLSLSIQVPPRGEKNTLIFFDPKKGEWDLSQQIAAAKIF